MTSWVMTVALLLGATVPVLITGYPATGGGVGGRDADIAMVWMDGFGAAMAEGMAWPRWLPASNGGFGSPVFLYYPPGAYWAGGAIMRLGVGADAVLPVLSSLAALVAFLGAGLLFRRTGGRAPWLCAALFAAFPYASFINLYVRGAFAEHLTIALMPLAGLALAASGRWRPAAIGVAIAAIVLTHLPTGVMLGGLMAAFIVLRAERVIPGLAGLGLGLALTAPYLLPAVTLQGLISADRWQIPALSWGMNLPFWGVLFDPLPRRITWLIHASLLVMLASLPLLLRRARDQLRQGVPRAVAGTCLLALLLMTPLSIPLWAALGPLQRIQFPWRFLGPAAFFWAWWLSLRLAQNPAASPVRAGLPAAALAAAMLALIPGVALLGRPMQFLPPGERLRAALAEPLAHPAEYLPHDPQERWLYEDGNRVVPPADITAEPVLEGGRIDAWRRTALGLDVAGTCHAACVLRLPQFAFPGWTVSGASEWRKDPDTGLITVPLPEGTFAVALRREALPAESRGWLIATGAAVLLLGTALLPGRRRVV